jgi:glycosyltransferase involved in cell wall biosynthesis
MPHAVPTDIFKKLEDNYVSNFRKDNLNIDEDNFLIYWTNRNARRKQSGSLLFWFKKFLDELEEKHGHRKATLLMHTDPKDPNGQDLEAIGNELDLLDNRHLLFSTDKIDLKNMPVFYNCADACITVSDAEGFGLFTFESLACETPIIATLTGGLQEQVSDIENVCEEAIMKRHRKFAGQIIESDVGIGLEPASKAIIGSQDVPYIYEDRLSEEQVVDSLMKMYEYGKVKRDELGKNGREHVLKNYNFEDWKKSWVKIIEDIHEKNGSWETRKNYKSWEMRVL